MFVQRQATFLSLAFSSPDHELARSRVSISILDPAEYSHTFVLYVSGTKLGPDIPGIIRFSGTVLPIGSRACC